MIVLTLHDGEEYRAAALAVGAGASVSKSHLASALVPTIRRLFTS